MGDFNSVLSPSLRWVDNESIGLIFAIERLVGSMAICGTMGVGS